MWDTASPVFSSCHHLIGSGVRSRDFKEKALRIRSEMVPFPPYIFTLPPFSNGTFPPEKGSTRARGAKVGSCCVLEEFLLRLSWHINHSSRSLLIRCLLECRTNTLDLFWADSTLPSQAPSTAYSLWQISLSSWCGAVQELESWHGCSVQARACGGVVVGNQLEFWAVSSCPLHLVPRSKQPCVRSRV